MCGEYQHSNSLQRKSKSESTKVARQFLIGLERPLGIFDKENTVGARERESSLICTVYLPKGTVGCKLKTAELLSTVPSKKRQTKKRGNRECEGGNKLRRKEFGDRAAGLNFTSDITH